LTFHLREFPCCGDTMRQHIRIAGARFASPSVSLSSQVRHASIFDHVEKAAADPILRTALDFKADTDPRKVNLGIGAYRSEGGKPWVLPAVLKAEELMLQEVAAGVTDKEYLPVDGLAALKPLTQKLIFGDADARIASCQTLSGTGSLRVLAEFLNWQMGCKMMYHSDPTWGNHPTIFKKCNMDTGKYPYWDGEKKGIKFGEWMTHLKNSPDKSLYLIHPCAHNPTGVDPSADQWKQIIDICLKKEHVVILDSAYQGYASGDLAYDRKAIKMFLDSGMEFFVCQSFAKNLGLYGERMGMLHAVCKNSDRAEAVLSQLKMVIRPMYSNPPLHGAHLVTKILGDEALYEQWCGELGHMADRILEVRSLLRKGLEAKGTPGKWNHITDQIGMFSFTGLTPAQCEALIKDHHIYLLKTGRISLAGLNKNNVQYVIDAIDTVVRNTK